MLVSQITLFSLNKQTVSKQWLYIKNRPNGLDVYMYICEKQNVFVHISPCGGTSYLLA